jgi:uncharacterized membrane protein
MSATDPARPPGRSKILRLNASTLCSFLFIVAALLPVLFYAGIAAVILAYYWQRTQPDAGWEDSHFSYHIVTFWSALAGTVISVATMPIVIGFFLLAITLILVLVRSMRALLQAQMEQPLGPGVSIL